MRPEIHIRCEDHPEANGREPKDGEASITLTFPTEDGKELHVEMGMYGFQILAQFVFDYYAGTPSYGDGSTNRDAGGTTNREGGK
jgi:hypothetical protein